MIPKIIHYCWLSGDPFPKEIEGCWESWEKYLPDYEFRLWDKESFKIDSIKWVRQAYEAKKYAFAADYIRLYVLYNYGGIYLDSDVLCYKPFNDLLHLPYFIGQDFVGAFEPAIIGAKVGVNWIKEVMDWYEDKEFINPDGSYNFENLPVIFFKQLFGKFNFKQIKDPYEFCFDERVFNLFSKEFFNGRNNIKSIKYNESYCSHLFAGSWTNKKSKKIYYNIPEWLLNKIYGINYHFIKKRLVHNYDPIYRQNNL